MSRSLEDITMSIMMKRQAIEKRERSLRRVREQRAALENSIPSLEDDIARLRLSLEDDAVELAGVADERKASRIAASLVPGSRPG
jgi:hypothetical protein